MKVLIKIALVVALVSMISTPALASTGNVTIISEAGLSAYGPIYTPVDEPDAPPGPADSRWDNTLKPAVLAHNSDWTATIEGASWISTADPTEITPADVQSSWRKFSASMTIPSIATNLSMKVCAAADNRIDFWLNGEFIGSHSSFTTTYCWTVIPKTGINTLEFIVKNTNEQNFAGKINPSGVIFKATATFDIEATVEINPETLNLGAQGRWITAYIELPEGYAVGDIDIGTVQLLHDTKTLYAEWGEVQEDGRLMVKFDRAIVAAWFNGLHDQNIELTVAGKVNDTSFEGKDTIRVIDPPQPGRGMPYGVGLGNTTSNPGVGPDNASGQDKAGNPGRPAHTGPPAHAGRN